MADPSDVAFSPTVKSVQERKGSRQAYAEMQMRRDITPDLIGFLAERDSFYLATVSADGQPYIQHRGGPKGFLRVLDARTLGWADYRGNRQYISIGNLADNAKAFIFLMDYANRRRIKLWGEARVVEGDAALIDQLMPQDYRARPEQAFLFSLTAWDINCPQHIPQKFAADDVAEALAARDQKIQALEQELAALQAAREADGAGGVT
ncbi:MAG: pyridoxamine 5'-phosphate oxidase family protein [Hyphomonadaceae bacterium]|nr:pyridoxamine 5'-phosphate oxidase family protein [Novosphingobium sp.]MBY0448082.1 pyridoxamine 5'-phosphate oxidase family protein [Hyphomonadaceae bacterium]